MNLNLGKHTNKKVQNFFKIHPPSQGLFSLPVKEGVRSCFSPKKTTKNAFKKAIYKKLIKIFCTNLFSRLDKILDFLKSNFLKPR